MVYHDTRYITDDLLGFQHTIFDLPDGTELRFGTQMLGDEWKYRWHHRDANARKNISSGEMIHLSIQDAISDFLNLTES